MHTTPSPHEEEGVELYLVCLLIRPKFIYKDLGRLQAACGHSFRINLM
jgi:hypothetical protein